MKIENFDYFKNVTNTTSVQGLKNVDSKEFDIDFKQVADQPLPTAGYSGAFCKTEAYGCVITVSLLIC